MRCRVLVGAPGAGKTTGLLAEMGSRPGRYLFAVPGLHLVAEFVEGIRSAAKAVGIKAPKIVEVHSGQRWDDPRLKAMPPRSKVHRVLSEVPETHGHEAHVVVVCTHDGMISADLSGFGGWHVITDEAPGSVATGTLRVPIAASTLMANYDLDPLEGTSYAKVSVKPGVVLNSRDIENDDYMADIALFHRRASSRVGVVVDVHRWEDAMTRKKTVSWFSVWTPVELGAFQSITFSAASYFRSIGYLVSRIVDGDAVEYDRVEVGADVVRAPRRVVIDYMTELHTGSTQFWTAKIGPGAECLALAGKYLAKNASPDQFWTSNDKVSAVLRAVDVPGDFVPPRVAGSNKWRNLVECSMIYSNKASEEDAVLLDLFGISSEAIKRAREVEDIGQFITRGAIRTPSWSGTYTVHLYSIDQAEAARQFLIDNGLVQPHKVVLRRVHAGIGLVFRQAGEWKQKPVASAESVTERKARRAEESKLRSQRLRDAAKAAAIAAETYRPRGRPPKKIG